MWWRAQREAQQLPPPAGGSAPLGPGQPGPGGRGVCPAAVGPWSQCLPGPVMGIRSIDACQGRAGPGLGWAGPGPWPLVCNVLRLDRQKRQPPPPAAHVHRADCARWAPLMQPTANHRTSTDEDHPTARGRLCRPRRAGPCGPAAAGHASGTDRGRSGPGLHACGPDRGAAAVTAAVSRLAAVLLAGWALAAVINTAGQGRHPERPRWQHPDPRTLARFPGP